MSGLLTHVNCMFFYHSSNPARYISNFYETYYSSVCNKTNKEKTNKTTNAFAPPYVKDTKGFINEELVALFNRLSNSIEASTLVFVIKFKTVVNKKIKIK